MMTRNLLPLSVLQGPDYGTRFLLEIFLVVELWMWGKPDRPKTHVFSYISVFTPLAVLGSELTTCAPLTQDIMGHQTSKYSSGFLLRMTWNSWRCSFCCGSIGCKIHVACEYLCILVWPTDCFIRCLKLLTITLFSSSNSPLPINFCLYWRLRRPPVSGYWWFILRYF